MSLSILPSRMIDLDSARELELCWILLIRAWDFLEIGCSSLDNCLYLLLHSFSNDMGL